MDLSGIRHSMSHLHSTNHSHHSIAKDIISNKPEPGPAAPPGPAEPAAAASAASGNFSGSCSQHSIKESSAYAPAAVSSGGCTGLRTGTAGAWFGSNIGTCTTVVAAAAAGGGPAAAAAAAAVGTIHGVAEAAEPVLGAANGNAACRHSMQASNSFQEPVWRPDYPGVAFQAAQAARMSHVYQSSLYSPPATNLSSPEALAGAHDHHHQQQQQQGKRVEASAAFAAEAKAQEEYSRWQQQQGRYDARLKGVNQQKQLREVEASAAFAGEAKAQEERYSWKQQQGRHYAGPKKVNHQQRQQQLERLGALTGSVADIASAARNPSGRSHGAAAGTPVTHTTPHGSDPQTQAASGAAAAATCSVADPALLKCSSDSRGFENGYRTVSSSSSSSKLATGASSSSSSNNSSSKLAAGGSSSSSNYSSGSKPGLAVVCSANLQQLLPDTHSLRSCQARFSAAATATAGGGGGPSVSNSAAGAPYQGCKSTGSSYAATNYTPEPLPCPDPTPSDSPVLSIMVGGERTTCASTASSLKLRRANARRPLTRSLTVLSSKAGLRCRHSMLTSSFLPQAPLASSAAAFPSAVAAAVPALAASMVLTPTTNFDQAPTATKFDQPNRTISRFDRHPRSRSMCIDQADYELQQLTYWWLVVDQVVDQMHGEGIGLQEQLEQLGQQQQKLQQMLHGMDQLRPVDIRNRNMKAARYGWGSWWVFWCTATPSDCIP